MLLHSVFVGFLLALTTPAQAEPSLSTAIAFDNGEFNTPLYTPRWNGRFSQPSIAQEIATSVGRVLGEHPAVFTYLPPGRVAGQPGQPYTVVPQRAACEADGASDDCGCLVGERCWTDLGANYHPGGSTSLYLTAAALRAAGDGPRVEIHVTDLFEEDPSSVDNPDDSDRCVTRTGTRKALEGLLNVGDGNQLEHVSVGVITATIDPPPPGPSHGFIYGLEEADGGCWSGVSVAPWQRDAGPQQWSMAVIVLGLNTAEAHEQVQALLDGLETQLDSERMTLTLVQVKAPAQSVDLDATLSLNELQRWQASAASEDSKLPCDTASAKARLQLGEIPVDASVEADCAGDLTLSVQPGAIRSAWAQAQGFWPGSDNGTITGPIEIHGDTQAVTQALAGLGRLNASSADRPLPFWDETVRTLEHAYPEASRAHLARISVQVSGLDNRPWMLFLMAGGVIGLSMMVVAYRRLLSVQADRAFRSQWDRAVGEASDPMQQTPVAIVLAAAQQDVRRKWPQRLIVSGGLGGLTGVLVVVVQAWGALIWMTHG